MTQALYAHMNNLKIKIKKKMTGIWDSIPREEMYTD
jgi:hypothetical protein